MKHRSLSRMAYSNSGFAALDPKRFQQLLLTRLQRMETDQASALDRALLDMQADLIARLGAQAGSMPSVLPS
jgi:hypothetical protein